MHKTSTPKSREHREANDIPIPYRPTGLDDQPIPFAVCPVGAQYPSARRTVSK